MQTSGLQISGPSLDAAIDHHEKLLTAHRELRRARDQQAAYLAMSKRRAEMLRHAVDMWTDAVRDAQRSVSQAGEAA